MELEDLFYEFVKARMNEAEQRRITSSSSILNKLDEESENEIKNELYQLILDRVRWNALINRIHADLAEKEDEDEEEEEKDYEDYDDSDEED